jgi:chorismate synthase
MLRFLTGGESHGPALVAIIDGLPTGLPIREEDINTALRRRQVGYGRGGRMQIERDEVTILGGVWQGCTIGEPLVLSIANRDWENWRDRPLPAVTVPRPGHADYAGMIKYGFDDARPVLERASARETAARVAVGAVAKILLGQFGIRVGSYVERIGPAVAEIAAEPLPALWARAEESDVRCPDPTAAQAMREAIDSARAAGDSLGGIFVVGAVDLPVGLGSHVQADRRLDARLAAAVMSIPAVKGVEIGPAFQNAALPGTQVHDEFLPGTYRRPRRASNRAGGLEGGMTNGMPLIVRAAMKPIPTTLTQRRSVDMRTGEPAMTRYERSDVCAVPAASVVGEAVVAWVLADAFLEKFGGDHMDDVRAHFQREAVVLDDTPWGSA